MTSHAQNIKTLVENRLLSIPGVSGVGTGIGSGEVVKVFVESDDIAKKVPKEIAGAETKTIIAGKPKFLNRFFSQRPLYEQTNRKSVVRPVVGGVSIGHKNITAGTMSTLCYDNKTGEKLLLSNNHVFANFNKGQIGDEILQPGAFDFGQISTDTVARLHKYVMVNLDNNIVDCALAKPISDDLISNEIMGVGIVSGVAEAKDDMVVKKSGRTTEVTYGTVTSTNATMKVLGDLGEMVFRDIIVTSLMGQGGDSGSLLLNEQNNAVGLLFAGSDTITLHCKIQNVMNLLNINFGQAPSPTTVKKSSLMLPLLAGSAIMTASFMSKKG